jgi:hypothetical protein
MNQKLTLKKKQKYLYFFLPQQTISMVRFMEPSTSTTTTKLLWLTTPRISNKQGTIVTNKNILNLALDTAKQLFPNKRIGSKALKQRISGSTNSMGAPLILINPWLHL